MTLLLLAALLLPQDTTPEDRILVRSMSGALRVWHAGTDKIEAAGAETRVAVADRLGTAKNEHASFVTEGDTMVGLKGVLVGREKGLALERSGKKLLLKLVDGKVVLESFESEVVLETPHGRVEGKGAYFFVEVTEKATRVVAIDGQLTFTNTLGTVVLEPEHVAVAQADRKPSDPKAAAVAEEVREFSAADATQNLLKNPGFENGLQNWASDNPDKRRTATLERSLAHSGKQSARIEVSARIYEKEKPVWLPFHQDVEVVPGRRYLVRAYLRTENRTGSVVPKLKVGYSEGEPECRTPCEKAWKMARVIFTAKDPTARIFFCVEIPLDSYDGMLWADDFFLTELPEPAKR